MSVKIAVKGFKLEETTDGGVKQLLQPQWKTRIQRENKRDSEEERYMGVWVRKDYLRVILVGWIQIALNIQSIYYMVQHNLFLDIVQVLYSIKRSASYS